MRDKINPSLESLFIASFQYTARLDAQNMNQSLEELTQENKSFYSRTISTFIKVASAYYDDKVIEEWIKTRILEEKKLPKLN